MPPVANEPRMPATFAKLFERGKKWTFPTTIVTRTFDDDKETTKTATGTLTCEVTQTTDRPARWTSVLACTATPELPSAFPMELVATPKGLFESYEGATAGGPLLDEPPVARDGHEDHPESEGSKSSGVTHKGTRWCFWYQQAVQGHVSSWKLCLRDGDLVGGSSDATDGAMVEMTWGDHAE